MEARELLLNLPLLRDLPSLQLAQLAQRSASLTLRAGQPLLALMARTPPVLYIAQGRMLATESLPCIAAQRTLLYPCGQWINLASLFSSAHLQSPHALEHSVLSAQALTPARIISMDREPLQALLPLNPGLTLQLARLLQEQLNLASALHAAHSSLPLPERVLFHMRLLAAQLNGSNIPFELPFPQRVLAQMVGCSREALIRTLRGLADDGRLTNQDNRYAVPE